MREELGNGPAVVGDYSELEMKVLVEGPAVLNI